MLRRLGRPGPLHADHGVAAHELGQLFLAPAFGALRALGQDHPERLKEILWGGYLHDPTGVYIEVVDGGQFTNHSNDPNCGGGWGTTPVEDFSIAVRDIAAGDEILEDYGVLDDGAS